MYKNRCRERTSAEARGNLFVRADGVGEREIEYDDW